jgi:hypothetical protein
MKRAFPSLFVGLVAACAAGGGVDTSSPVLPSAGVGPFRDLAAAETKGIAPFILEDSAAQYREPAVLDDGAATLLYAVAHEATGDAIVRTRADDGRSFFGASSSSLSKPPVVLRADAAWEGTSLGGPSALRRDAEVWLYYAARGGIGLARGDGLSFHKTPGPVLAPAASEAGSPHAPSVYVLPDGRLRMLYAAGAAIFEAESTDGALWRRLGTGPVLAPTLRAGDFDAVAASDPCASPRTTPAGRLLVRVLYTGTNDAGTTAIGFAGRYGDTGPFERQPSPVYAVGRKEAAPALSDRGDISLLYVQEELQSGDQSWLAIAAAVTPLSAQLSSSRPFSPSP